MRTRRERDGGGGDCGVVVAVVVAVFGVVGGDADIAIKITSKYKRGGDSKTGSGKASVRKSVNGNASLSVRFRREREKTNLKTNKATQHAAPFAVSKRHHFYPSTCWPCSFTAPK